MFSALRAVRRCGLVAVAVAAFLASAARAAHAGDVELFAGGQVDFSNDVYLGATLPFGPNDRSGFGVRGYFDTGGYDYIGGGIGTVKATFTGEELDAIYRVMHAKFWSDFGVGFNNTNTSLTPNDPSNPLRGAQTELRLSADGGAISGPWRADWYGYYGTRIQDYAANLGVTHSIAPAWRLGLDGYSEGNPTYNLYEVGPYAGVSFAKDSELQFSVGEAWQSGFTPRAYFRAMVYTRL
ncbi:MAG TPA: cellulose biosynthesis protein BcsS [Candidatus Binatia bacterium]|nr:cellulose biosynthesis protein BcsS [Candidatus Binatia bacterium]